MSNSSPASKSAPTTTTPAHAANIATATTTTTTSAATPAHAANIAYEVADQTATITLNRPDLRNVLSVEALRELHDALARTAADDDVRVVVLTGSGNTFCAGADLKGASSAATESDAWDGPGAIVKVLEALLDHPKPTIARVQGHVAGGGNGLVAGCDLSVAAESVKLAFSEVRLGLAPAIISVVCLNRMSVSDGYELLLTGERVSAQRAAAAGLLNRVVPDVELDVAVAEYVDKLRRGGPLALAATKELLRRVRTLPRHEAFSWTADLSASRFASAEAAAGMAAFLKREPAPWAPSV